MKKFFAIIFMLSMVTSACKPSNERSHLKPRQCPVQEIHVPEDPVHDVVQAGVECLGHSFAPAVFPRLPGAEDRAPSDERFQQVACRGICELDFDFGRGKPARRLGIYFHANNGTLFSNYTKYEVVPEGDFLKDSVPPPEAIPPSPGHEREWLDCIKSRKQPSCNVNYHYKVDLAITLANLSYRLGRSIHFDPAAEKRFIGDKQAAKLARPIYRQPWKFPTQYLPKTETRG